MTKLIIVCGLPGSGKTTLAMTLAKALSKKLNIACFHKDEIKECLFEIQNGTCLEDSHKCGSDTIKLLYHLAECQIRNRVDLILESPFKHPQDYPIVEKWIAQNELKAYLIICSIDLGEREHRFRTRERHHAHFDQEGVVFGRHFDGEEYDYKDMPGKQIRIKTDKSAKELVKQVIEEIS